MPLFFRCLRAPLIFFISILFLGMPVDGFDAPQSRLAPPTVNPSILPTEIVESTPIDIFSERASHWPSTQKPADLISPESREVLDALIEIPGIQSSKLGSPFVSIRGSEATSRVLGVYDGLSVNLGDGYGLNNLLIPRESLQDLVIFKGPASLFYGADAVGGVLQMTSRTFTRPAVRGHIGSFGQRGIFGAVPLIPNNSSADSATNHAQITAFQESNSGDFPFTVNRTGTSGTRERNDSDLHRFTFSGRQALSPQFFLSEKLVYARQVSSSPVSLNSAPSLRSPTASQITGTLAALTGSYTLNDFSRFTFRSSHTSVENDSLSEKTQSRTRSKTTRFSNQFSAEREFFKNETDVLHAEFLAESHLNQYDSLLTGGAFKTRHDPELGVVLKLFHHGSDPGLIQGGVRYVPQYGAWVKTIGFSKGRDLDQTWITYSEGFSPPSLTSLYEDAFSFSYQSNPSLKPEFSDQVEIGFSKSHQFSNLESSKLNTSFSVFRINYKDLKTTTTNGAGYLQHVNEQKATAYGIETGVGYSISVWNFSGEYTYLETQDTTGTRPLPRSPNNQAALTVSHVFGPIVLEGKQSYWGIYYLRDSSRLVQMDPWTTTDLTLRTLALTNWTFRAGLLNIFNTSRELTLGFPEPQQRFYTSLERQF